MSMRVIIPSSRFCGRATSVRHQPGVLLMSFLQKLSLNPNGPFATFSANATSFVRFILVVTRPALHFVPGTLALPRRLALGLRLVPQHHVGDGVERLGGLHASPGNC